MDLLQLNKFGDLHNGRSVIFCKTELLNAEFAHIKKIKNEVVLISGNSDDEINENLVSKMPGNIIAWYCQNNLVNNPRLISIPIGLENTFPNKRKKHGIGWPHALSKVQLLGGKNEEADSHQPSKFLYANFNVQTNAVHRGPIMDVCKKTSFIDWDEPNLNYDDFIEKVLDHEAIVCPAGNGIDTHRLYEILYCKRIPVTIKIGDYAIYKDLYEKLPIVILHSVDELENEKKIRELISIARQKSFNNKLLDFNYWKNLITGEASRIVTRKARISYAFNNLFNRHS